MTTTYSTRSNASRAARKAGLAADAFEVFETEDGKFAFRAVEASEEVPEFLTRTADEAAAELKPLADEANKPVSVATENQDVGIFPAVEAEALAQEYANDHNVTVTIRDAITDEVIKVVAPQVTRKGPTGMVAKIIDLAVREEGVTPAELNTLTNWKGAPWKWLFSNWKGTGYADRWGYNLIVTKNAKKVAYKLVTKPVEG